MKVEKGPRDFYKLIRPSRRVIEWLKYEIPHYYRYFEQNHWYVHKKHLDEVKQLGVTMSDITIPSGIDDYATLYLLPSAPPSIVDVVWRTLARMHHPDRGGDEEIFKRLNVAYQKIKGGKDA
jgi:hypothetical protein